MALVPKRYLDGVLSQTQEEVYEVYEEIGEEMGLTKYQVELVIDDFYKRFRLTVEDPRMPKVVIDEFFLVETKPKKLRKYLLQNIAMFKRKNSKSSFNRLFNIIRTFWKSYKRLQHEDITGGEKGYAVETHLEDPDEFYNKNVLAKELGRKHLSESKYLKKLDKLHRRKVYYDLPERYDHEDTTHLRDSGYLGERFKEDELYIKEGTDETEQIDFSTGKRKRKRRN